MKIIFTLWVILLISSCGGNGDSPSPIFDTADIELTIVGEWSSGECRLLEGSQGKTIQSSYSFDEIGGLYSYTSTFSDSNCELDEEQLEPFLMANYSIGQEVETPFGYYAYQLTLHIVAEEPPPEDTVIAYYSIEDGELCLSSSIELGAGRSRITFSNYDEIDFNNCLIRTSP